MKKLSAYGIGVSIMVIACLLVVMPSAYAAKTLKIGIVDCYSGPPATYTNDVRDAFKMEAEKINAVAHIEGFDVEVQTAGSGGIVLRSGWKIKIHEICGRVVHEFMADNLVAGDDILARRNHPEYHRGINLNYLDIGAIPPERGFGGIIDGWRFAVVFLPIR